MGWIETFSSETVEAYLGFVATLPSWIQNFLTLFVLVLLIVIYSVFIWKFYRFISKKNIISLNLNKYNKSNHPILTKALAATFYFIEYIIILPFLIFFWFTVFTLFLIFLTEGLELSSLLIISATIIAAIRMTAYYKGNLSKDLAKLLPFTLLAISITKPNFFDIERILVHLEQLPNFFNEISIYLAFIIVLEIVLRFFEFIFSLFGINKTPKIKDQN